MFQEFYKGLNTTKSSVKGEPTIEGIPPTLDDFMMDVVKKFKCFQLQYETDWLDKVYTFYNDLQDLSDYLNNYRKEFVSKIYTNGIVNLTNKYNFIKHAAGNVVEDTEADYLKIHEKLKVLHGHPKNRNLLEKLNKEILQYKSTHENTMDDFLVKEKVTKKT